MRKQYDDQQEQSGISIGIDIGVFGTNVEHGSSSIDDIYINKEFIEKDESIRSALEEALEKHEESGSGEEYNFGSLNSAMGALVIITDVYDQLLKQGRIE